jgi:hypothetical protein
MVSPCYLRVSGDSLHEAYEIFEFRMTDQHQDMMYVPEEPLIHGELLAKGGLQLIKSMDSSIIGQTKHMEPCIVFTGDYHSVNRGPVKWFLNRWKSSTFNLCVFVGKVLGGCDNA